MSVKKRGIMLKSLTLEDEGMQELINPVPLDLVIDEDPDLEIEFDVKDLIEREDQAVRDVLEMLEETLPLLTTGKQ